MGGKNLRILISGEGGRAESTVVEMGKIVTEKEISRQVLLKINGRMKIFLLSANNVFNKGHENIDFLYCLL